MLAESEVSSLFCRSLEVLADAMSRLSTSAAKVPNQAKPITSFTTSLGVRVQMTVWQFDVEDHSGDGGAEGTAQNDRGYGERAHRDSTFLCPSGEAGVPRRVARWEARMTRAVFAAGGAQILSA
jgi:hypothetical protein